MVYLKKIFLAALFVGVSSSALVMGASMSVNANPAPVDIGFGEMYMDWVMEGNLEGIQMLIKFGFDVNSKLESIDCAGEMKTLLHVAAEFDQVYIARILLSAGAKIDSVDGLSPLHVAVVNGHLDIVQILLEFGADCDAKVSESLPRFGGLTAREIARNKGFEADIQTMIDDEKEIRTRKRTHNPVWFRCDCEGDEAGHGKEHECKKRRTK